MNILVIANFFRPAYLAGGPVKSLQNLCDFLSKHSSVFVYTGCSDLDGSSLPVKRNLWLSVSPNLSLFYSSVNIFLYVFRLLNFIRKKDVIYINSFFSFKYSIIPIFLCYFFASGKVFLAPRGELLSGALCKSPFRKKIYISIFKLFKFMKYVEFHATSVSELNAIHNLFGCRVRVFRIENLVNNQYAQNFPARSEILKLAFVGRIVPHKNLAFAIQAISKSPNPVSLYVWGFVEDREYWVYCQNLIEALPSDKNVYYNGVLAYNRVIQEISSCDAFILPTKGENFGHSIFEAASAGLPLIISDNTPWKCLKDYGVGWDLSLSDPQEFSNAINELYSLSVSDYNSLRFHVLEWAKDISSQSHIEFLIYSTFILFQANYE